MAEACKLRYVGLGGPRYDAQSYPGLHFLCGTRSTIHKLGAARYSIHETKDKITTDRSLFFFFFLLFGHVVVS